MAQKLKLAQKSGNNTIPQFLFYILLATGPGVTRVKKNLKNILKNKFIIF